MSLTPISQERRAHPVAFFREILSTYFVDNSWEEALGHWRRTIRNGPPVPEDTLWCLDWVVAHPPENLPQLLAEDGWLDLRHPGSDSELGTPFSFEELVAWLREKTAAFREEYDKAQAETG